MRPVGLLALIVLVIAGCSGPASETTNGTPSGPAGPDAVLVTCRAVDKAGDAVATATCHYRFPSQDADARVAANGTAAKLVAKGDRGTLFADAPGRLTARAELTITNPVTVSFTLAATTGEGASSASSSSSPQSSSGAPSSGPGATLGSGAGAPTATSVAPRSWLEPITVLQGSGLEPHVAVDAEGRIYYAPVNDLYRSVDGGATFQLVSPTITEALPVLGGDTSVQIAPDGSLWWSRYWGYAGGTIGCTSTNHAESWTCDNLALPGVTDRMWIAGKDGSTGYVQTNEGLYHHVWAQTTTGSLKYAPYATTTTLLAVRNGNMVYDEVNDAFWQIEFTGGTQKLYRVDGALGLLSARDTGVPNTYALPWLAVSNGTLWTTGEGEGGSGVLAARSTDAGATWSSFPIQSEAKSVTFSYIGAGPNGRVALTYYGSDKEGPSTTNGGTWSLYIAETDNGLAENPVWIETKLVPNIHVGNLCIGLNCEGTGGDPQARFAGDLIGAWVDLQGNAHLAYMEEQDGTFLARYVRQVAA